MKRSGYRSTARAVLAICLSVSAVGVPGQDLKAADIIKKHLEAIGPAQTRSGFRNRFVVGKSAFASKLPDRKTAGKALIVSQGADLMFAASFLSQEYPFEKIGYFNDRPSLPFVTAGARSPLGAFIADHETMLSHGLFTGSISSSWPFHENAKPRGRVDTSGTKKVNGRKAYVIDYYPTSAGSAEYTIKLFFDAETFHHLRTEYRHVIAPQQDPFGTLGRQTGVRISLTEDFSEFKLTGGLTLPHFYRISYVTDSNSGVYEYEWGITVTDYFFNQNLEPGFFTFETKPGS